MTGTAPLSKTPRARKPAAEKEAAPKTGVPMKLDERLGMLVRCSVTGFEGLTMQRCEMLNGNVQYAVQPKGQSDSMTDGHLLDFHTLEVIGEGVSKKLPPVDTTPTLKIGQKVRDTISGFKGVIVEKTLFQNGCVYFSVQAPAGRKHFLGEMPNAIRFPHQRLELVVPLHKRIAKAFAPQKKPLSEVGKNIDLPAPKPQPKPEVDTRAARPPGGPMRSVSSMRTV